MEGLLRSIRELTRLQIVLLAAVIVAAFGLTAFGYNALRSAGADTLEENQRLVPVTFGSLATNVAINGSVAFTNTSTLTFGSSGTIAEILVSEGDTVEAGAPLVGLDGESIAGLQQAVAQARIEALNAETDLARVRDPKLQIAEAESAVADARVALSGAQDALDTLIEPDAQAAAVARAAVTAATIALQAAQEELDLLLEPDPRDVAEAETAVLEAEIAAADARTNLSEDVADAVADVNAATNDLTSARKDLELAQASEDIRDAEEAYEEAKQDYLDAHTKWTGAVLTEEELQIEPFELIESWGMDLEHIYSTAYNPFPDQRIADDPETRWNEITIYGWVRLFPGVKSIEVTCSLEQTTSTGRSTASTELCIQRDFHDVWEVFENASFNLDNAVNRFEREISNAEAAVIRAEDALKTAQKAADDLTTGFGTDLLEKRYAVALAALTDAKIAQEELMEPDPDEIEDQQNQVSVAAAQLAAAQDELSDLLDPDDARIEQLGKQVDVAQANLDNAIADLENLTRMTALEIELNEAALAAANAALNGSLQRYENSTLAAPWAGYISAIEVELGEDVGATTAIVTVIDPTLVTIDGVVDEIDVLSVTPGVDAAVTMDALPGQLLEAKVLTVSSAGSSQQGVVTFAVEVEVRVPEGLRLQQGLSAVANVSLEEHSGLLVPGQAISGTIDAPQVMVERNGRIVPQVVSLGASDGFWTIVNSGLSEGDQVVMEVTSSTTQDFGFRVAGGGAVRTFNAPR